MGTAQTSLALGTSQAVKLVKTVDLRTIALPEGSLSADSVDDKVIMSTLKNISLHLLPLPNEYLHTLQIGVTAELIARERHALNLISEYQVNNEQMFG